MAAEGTNGERRATVGPMLSYLDPGTGSMILQVLLGGVAGIALAGKLYWQRLRSMLGIDRRDESEESERR